MRSLSDPVFSMNQRHVLKALFMDEKWGLDCTETLNLLSFYGPDGSRLVDTRIVEMMSDKTPPGLNAKPAKRFLRLLRQIDQDWLDQHPGATTPGYRGQRTAEVNGKERASEPTDPQSSTRVD